VNTKFISALILVLSATLSSAAFASGYGPAPYYSPSVGAPASQRGQSAQTVTAERESTSSRAAAYGQTPQSTSQAATDGPMPSVATSVKQ
jgi:hypothetical protein